MTSNFGQHSLASSQFKTLSPTPPPHPHPPLPPSSFEARVAQNGDSQYSAKAKAKGGTLQLTLCTGDANNINNPCNPVACRRNNTSRTTRVHAERLHGGRRCCHP